MYEYISGILVSISENTVVVENNGIGYLINIPFELSSKLGTINNETKVYVYQNVKENEISLFGFSSLSEKNMFIQLLNVSGVGPKVAHAICAQIEPDVFVAAVINGEVNLLTKVKGLGKKGAERIIVELKDKLKKLSGNTTTLINSKVKTNTEMLGSVSSVIADAVDALVLLGYKEVNASEYVESAYESGDDLQKLIKKALKLIGKH